MSDGRVFLKVKIKSLAAEARIIRRETKRAPREFRASLSEHRRHVVRPAARTTLLAYGFLRGRDYAALEAKRSSEPDWKEVERLVRKYGVGPTLDGAAQAEQAERWRKWIESARAAR